MVTVAHVTKRLISDRLLINEYLREGIINYYALAERLLPTVENELGKPVKISTIAMALRRFSEASKKVEVKNFPTKEFQLIMKGSLCDIVVFKSGTLFDKLKNIYSLVDYNKGELLNVVHGNYEVAIIINQKFEQKTLSFLKGEKILNIERDLVSLTLRFGKSFVHTPGITYTVLQQLVIENVNLIEVFSSLLEDSMIINKKDSTRAYRALQEWIDRN
jgi:hypothetical protein